ncbi:hypothetical protein KI387_015114, partial [Taxus chinensis]
SLPEGSKMAKGGGSAGVLVLILVTLLINIQVEGRSYDVGWGFVSYKKLSATKFKRGDSLVFNYPRSVHDVVQVGGLKDYTNCVVSKGARKNKSGHDKITLR